MSFHFRWFCLVEIRTPFVGIEHEKKINTLKFKGLCLPQVTSSSFTCVCCQRFSSSPKKKKKRKEKRNEEETTWPKTFPNIVWHECNSLLEQCRPFPSLSSEESFRFSFEPLKKKKSRLRPSWNNLLMPDFSFSSPFICLNYNSCPKNPNVSWWQRVQLFPFVKKKETRFK